MKHVTLANIRAHKSRLVAVSIAVILAVAFMAATLLLASSTKATLRATIGEAYAKADAVVHSYEEGYETSVVLTPEDVARIGDLPGVTDASGHRSVSATLGAVGERQGYALVREVMTPGLDPSTLIEGRMPETEGETVIDESSLTLFEVGVGDEVTVSISGLAGDPQHTLTIVGVAQASKDPFQAGLSTLIVHPQTVDTITGQFEDMTHMSHILVSLDASTSASDFAGALSELEFEGFTVDERGEMMTGPAVPVVQTPDEIVDEQVRSFTEDTNMLTAVLLAFVGVALFVAGLVISNTFSVLVAQRARELALLRCVGASTKQVHRSVLAEALIMGFVSSVLGVLLAIGLISGLIFFAGGIEYTASVGVFAMDWHAIVWPIVVGVLVTLIAANGPAREATRVSPLEAMRARATDEVTGRAGRARLIGGSACLITGAAIIATGMFQEDPVMALLITLLGAVISAIGVLMLAVFVIPRVTHALGRIFGSGVPGKLAAYNTIRNPKRTAATASALLVGVTLVATVYTGAEVAKATLDRELEASFPVDMAVVMYYEGADAMMDVVVTETTNSEGEVTIEHRDADGNLIDPDAGDPEAQQRSIAENLAKLRGLEGVEAVAPASEAYVVTVPDSFNTQLWGIDPADLATVVRDETATLEAGEALLGSPVTGDTVEVVGDAGSLTFSARQAGAPRNTVLVTPEDFQRIAGQPGTGEQYTWVALMRLSDSLGAQEILDIRDELSSIVPMSYVMGEGIERAMYERIIAMLLLIVTALLAVAIVIAVIGIGNTLSLSVIERTRENALIRALGLTRGQLRGMLASEALLTAFTAALIGVILGVGYGFAGSQAVLGPFGDVEFQIPWGALGVILVAALAAGLIASVMPARRAMKLSPVEGLSTV